jgi:hypothetical protein
MLELTPTLQYVFFRSRRFSPFVYGGVGPVFFNHGAGTHGQWVAGPGVSINVAGPLYVNLGVGFSGLFPTGRCNDALTYQPEDPTVPGVLLDLCSFRWGPQVGMVLAFGGGRGRERRPPPREREPVPEPASNPLDEAVVPEPELEAPSDVAEPPPDGTEGIEAEPPADTEPVDSPSGETTAPVDSPSGEATAPVDSPLDESTAPGSTDVPLPPQSGRIAPLR